MDLKVTCQRCDCEITHRCRGESLQEAAVALYKWRPEGGFPEALKEDNDYISVEDGIADVDRDDMPFVCEVFLYALLGKEDARTLMALIGNVIEASGVESRSLQMKAYKQLADERAKREKEMKRREEAQKKMDERLKPLVQTDLPSGFKHSTYRDFFAFDTNVHRCEQGRCLETKEQRTSRVEPNIDNAKFVGGNVEVVCFQCKRIHVCSAQQVEGWKTDPKYKSEKHTPDYWLRADKIRILFGFERR